MSEKFPRVSINILVIKDNKFLLGLLTNKWLYQGKQVYGVPGRDIKFNEKFGDAIKRNIKEEFGCNVLKYEIICVNANYAWENHYIGVGAIVEIDSNPKLLLSEDWEKWEWFSKDRIPNNLFPEAKNLIKCYFDKKVNVSE
jgi:ADP-ribose pyrophosphatase YjhB (NUDIX family)